MASGRKVAVLALDIDGTLLTSKKEISAQSRETIDAARSLGVKLVFVTGRRYPAAKKIADQLGGEFTLVLHNGGLVVDGGIPIRVRPIHRSVAREIVSFSKQRGADPVVHFGHRGEGLLFVETMSPSHTLLAYYLNRSHPDVRIVESLESSIDIADEDPMQVMFGGGMEEMRLLAEALDARRFDACAHRTVYPQDDLSLIDVVASTVDKAEAMRFVCARWGLSMEAVLAIGDNWNDRRMLEEAGVGCVMGNADAELRALDLTLVPDNDSDGVAAAIRRFVLEPALR